MYLYYNSKGVLLEKISETPLRQGNNNVNTMYIFIEPSQPLQTDTTNSKHMASVVKLGSILTRYQQIAADSEPTIEYMFEGDEYVQTNIEIPYDRKRDLKFFQYYTTYEMFVIPLPSGQEDWKNTDGDTIVAADIFSSGGGYTEWFAQIRLQYLTNSEPNILALGVLTLPIEGEVCVHDTSISTSQFDYLVWKLAKANNIFWATFGSTTYSSIETAINADKLPVCYYENVLYVYATKTDSLIKFSALKDGRQYSVSVNSSNDWISASSAVSSVFFATYGTTTMLEIGNAISSGEVPVCYYNNNLYVYSTTNASPPSVKIVFARVEGTMIYELEIDNNNTWTTKSRALQTELTFDSEPTPNSDNPVTSDGIYNIVDTIYTALGYKQDTLESGVNIKTINGNSLLGSGDITISSSVGISLVVVSSVSDLPATGADSTIYLIPNGGIIPNYYDEYIWTGTTYERIGTTQVDLTNYYTKTETDTKLATKQNTIEVNPTASSTNNPLERLKINDVDYTINGIVYWATYGTTTYSQLTVARYFRLDVACFYNNKLYRLVNEISNQTTALFSCIIDNVEYQLECDSSSNWTATTKASAKSSAVMLLNSALTLATIKDNISNNNYTAVNDIGTDISSYVVGGLYDDLYRNASFNNSLSAFSITNGQVVTMKDNTTYLFSSTSNMDVGTLIIVTNITSNPDWVYAGQNNSQAYFVAINSYIEGKQDTLVSGVNIKSVNNTSLLGSGNLDTTELFYCTYGTTTYAEITQALSDGKILVCFYNGVEYIYVGLSSTNRHTFSSQLFDTNRYVSVNSSDSWSIGSNNLETISNKVTSISNSSTNTQYPSAKCVYDALQNVSGSGTQLYKHTLNLGSSYPYAMIISTSNSHINYDYAMGGFKAYGDILSVTYWDDNNGGLYDCLLVDVNAHSRSEYVFNKVAYVDSAGAIQIETIPTNADDSVVEL